VFRGVTNLTIDGKGRLAMPARYREALLGAADGKLVVTTDSPSCLLIYASPDWEPIEAKLMNLSAFDPRIRDLQRLLVGYASDVEMDSAGRILIPAPLRKFAGLDREAALVGQGRRFELWDVVKWDQQIGRAVELTGAGMPPELEGFSL